MSARQDGEVDAEGTVCEPLALLDFLAQVVRRRLGQRRDETERTGIGDTGHEFGAADPLHAALHDGVIHPEHFRESCFEHVPSPSAGVASRGPEPFAISNAAVLAEASDPCTPGFLSEAAKNALPQRPPRLPWFWPSS